MIFKFRGVKIKFTRAFSRPSFRNLNITNRNATYLFTYLVEIEPNAVLRVKRKPVWWSE